MDVGTEEGSPSSVQPHPTGTVVFQRQIRGKIRPPPKTENYQRILDNGLCWNLCWGLGAGAHLAGTPAIGESDN